MAKRVVPIAGPCCTRYERVEIVVTVVMVGVKLHRCPRVQQGRRRWGGLIRRRVARLSRTFLRRVIFIRTLVSTVKIQTTPVGPMKHVLAPRTVVEHHVTKVKMVVLPVMLPPCVHPASIKRRLPLLPRTVSVRTVVPANFKIMEVPLPVLIAQSDITKVVTLLLPVPIHTPPSVHPARINRRLPLLPRTVSVPIAKPANTKIKMVKAHALDALRVALEKDKRLIVLRHRIVFVLKTFVLVPMAL